MSTNGTPHIAQTVGANIRAARLRLGLTQQQLATAIGGKVSSRDVSRWENGRIEPAKHRQPLADLLFDGDTSALYEEPVAA